MRPQIIPGESPEIVRLSSFRQAFKTALKLCCLPLWPSRPAARAGGKALELIARPGRFDQCYLKKKSVTKRKVVFALLGLERIHILKTPTLNQQTAPTFTK